MTRWTAHPLLGLLTFAFTFACLSAASAQTKPPRRDPLRLTSIGDSISEATNAEEFNPFKGGLTRNRWASWVNGFEKSSNRLFDRTNVNSHNQRIDELFPGVKRKNKKAAKAGADSEDIAKQARKAVKVRSDYVTVLMGHNDVCGDEVEDIPDEAEFEANVRAGFDVLRGNPLDPKSPGLPDGATIYTLAIIDVERLSELGVEFLGLVECEDLWEILADEDIPCATLIDPDFDPVDRETARNRLLAFNEILRSVSAEYDATDTRHYWNYSDVTFLIPWTEEHVSEIDCFHPSAEGQTLLAEVTWNAGPFAAAATATPTPTATATPSATPTPTPTATATPSPTPAATP